MGGPPAWGLGGVLTTLHRKNLSCHEIFTQMDLQEVGYGGMEWIELAQDSDR